MDRLLIISFLAIVFFSSCKSTKSVSSKNHSSSQASSKNKNRKVEFLNGIEVKGGGAAYSKSYTLKNKKVVYAPPEFIVTNVNIEKLNLLQVKYAIILDATAEQLTNVPLFQTIDHWWGTPYCYGGSTENCIDCSAFVQTVVKTVFGVSIPRTAQQQFDNSEKINIEELKEGDLVFFHTSGGEISHVGLYLLNNKFVHASSSSGVMVSDLNDDYWKQRYAGAGRVR